MAATEHLRYDGDNLAATLEPVGPKANPIEGTPTDSILVLYDDGRVSTGIWECTPGSWPSARVGMTEFCHVVAGSGTIVHAGGSEDALVPGASITLPDGWHGTWVVTETLRKAWTTVLTAGS